MKKTALPPRLGVLAALLLALLIYGASDIGAPLPPSIPATSPALAFRRALLRDVPEPGPEQQRSRPPQDPAPALPATTEILPRQEPTVPERAPTADLVFFLSPGADGDGVARDYGLQVRHALPEGMSAWAYRAETPEAAAVARRRAATDRRVTHAFFDRKIVRTHFAFDPQDPLIPGDGTTAGQWHLAQANLPGAWNLDITGKGVILSIVDDGLQFTHPDLAGNFVAADSLNFGASPPNSNYGPDLTQDGGIHENNHGTCVAGVAAAVGGNGIGVTGTAPQAGIAVQRLNFASLTESTLASAVGYHSTSTPTTIKVKNHSYGANVTFFESDVEATAIANSTASGTVHVFAAGNGFGTPLEDSNKLMPQNSPDVINVAAIGSDGTRASYSSVGANVFVTAPSSSAFGFGITTTDRLGAPGFNDSSDPLSDPDYTSVFGGTSSAAPLVSGIVALARQVQPNLTARLVQHALVRSSDQVHPGDSGLFGGGDGSTAGSAWITNRAGRPFNQKYGFGRINAGNFVLETLKYKGVTPLLTETHAFTVNAAIPDNDPAGTEQTFSLASTTPLESIIVALDITHGRRGDLEVYLTSPGATPTVCRLMMGETGEFMMPPSTAFSPDTGTLPDGSWPSNYQWPLLSNAFWGENPSGAWKLRVADRRSGVTGTLNKYTVTARMGTPVADNVAPTVVSSNRAGSSPTSASPLTYTVKFSKYVTGVDATDFAVTTTGTISGASVLGVSGSIDTYTVTVDPGFGAGTVRLNVVDDDTIVDGAGNPLGGPGLGNGNFTTGQTYAFTGTAVDGISGPDIDTQTSLTTISAHWEGFIGIGTGVVGYRWAIGTTPGGTEVQGFTDVGLALQASTSMVNQTLALTPGTTYYVAVESRDSGGITTVVVSDGVQVLAGSTEIPEPPAHLDAFSLSPTSVRLIWLPSPTPGVAGYRLWYKLSSAPWTAAALVDNLTGVTTDVSGLTKGSSYDFQLRAVLAGGNESTGLFAGATPTDPITVNGVSFGSIQAAINGATAGQTVLIQAGTYSENLTLNKALTLSGISPKYTLIAAPDNALPAIAVGATGSTTITQLTASGGSIGVDAGNSAVLIRNVVLHHNASHGVSALAPSVLQVISCTVAHNGGMGIVAAGTATTVRNDIVASNASVGVSVPAAAAVSFTDAYGNGTRDFDAGVTTSACFSSAATFRDEAGNDYTETTTSASIDGGDPNDPFALEPDYNGGRINLGAFGNTSWAATSPVPRSSSGGGGGGGGCGLTGLETVLLAGLVCRRRIRRTG